MTSTRAAAPKTFPMAWGFAAGPVAALGFLGREK
ncbi:MAG: hypothetical protein QOE54_7050 [Streptosporangiaceae bacterium]|jgi:hypothetical protein|nr:hypothetical protein [Streptosporangiaceae bacterium]MDX6434684.1 hypothetical protein [Streptosporangiaceae bacterium]